MNLKECIRTALLNGDETTINLVCELLDHIKLGMITESQASTLGRINKEYNKDTDITKG